MTAAARPLRRGSVYAEHTQTPAASRMKRPISCMKFLTCSVPVKAGSPHRLARGNRRASFAFFPAARCHAGASAASTRRMRGPLSGSWMHAARTARIPHTAPELNSIPLAGPTRPPGTQRRLNPRQLRGDRPLPMRSGREGCALCRGCSSTYRYHRSQAVTAPPVDPVQRVPGGGACVTAVAPDDRGPSGNNCAILAADASRRATLLVAFIHPVCALLAPCRAAPRRPEIAQLFPDGP